MLRLVLARKEIELVEKTRITWTRTWQILNESLLSLSGVLDGGWGGWYENRCWVYSARFCF